MPTLSLYRNVVWVRWLAKGMIVKFYVFP